MTGQVDTGVTYLYFASLTIFLSIFNWPAFHIKYLGLGLD